MNGGGTNIPIFYDRQAAVQYARTWWDGRNPRYPDFEDDCTNFISQCLRAGGAPMTGMPNRGRGWWITDGWQTGKPRQFARETWSYSWSVAQAFKLHLDNSKSGLTAKRVNSFSELTIGDVICYDFEGDGRINHTTMVTTMFDGVPYIHAHTVNSADRLFDYRNSRAYTPNTIYYYYKIDDVFQ